MYLVCFFLNPRGTSIKGGSATPLPRDVRGVIPIPEEAEAEDENPSRDSLAREFLMVAPPIVRFIPIAPRSLGTTCPRPSGHPSQIVPFVPARTPLSRCLDTGCFPPRLSTSAEVISGPSTRSTSLRAVSVPLATEP